MTLSTLDGPIRLLHLSDIHFRSDTEWDHDAVLRDLAAHIGAEVAAGMVPDLIVITGDLAFSGQQAEYGLVKDWLANELWPALQPDGAVAMAPDRLLLVPGNHDLDRNEVNRAAKALQKELLTNLDQQNGIAEVLRDKDQRQILLKRHSRYLAFCAAWLGQSQRLPWWQRSITIRGQTLHVAGLDSAWMACGEQDRGKLLLGRYQINQTVDVREAQGADWRIALMHHPWDYFAEADGHEARETVHRCCDLLLRGHLHRTASERIVPPAADRACLELAAGCVYEGSDHPNAFQWIELHPRPRRVRVHYRAWLHGAWSIDRNQSGAHLGYADYELASGISAEIEPEATDLPTLASTAPISSITDRAHAGSEASLAVAQPKPRTGLQQQTDESPMADGAFASSQREDHRCDVLLLYVNETERAAIVATFTGADGRPPQPRSIRGLPFLDIGWVGPHRVFAAGTNMGSATPGGTASATVDAINKLDPGRIIAVGVAFGMDLDKTALGSILVSSRISCYEPQRIGTGLSIRRGDSVAVHLYLQKHFEQVSAPPYWKGVAVHFGEILSGEKLIDDPAFKAELKAEYPEAIGGEMEAAGIYSAAMLEQRAWIVIKAVCDFADGYKGVDKGARQTAAAENAARFVNHVLTAYSGDADVGSESTGVSAVPPSDTDMAPEQDHGAADIRRDAVSAIKAILETQPLLCAALGASDRVRCETPAGLTDWLLRPGAEVLRSGIFALRSIIPDALAMHLREGRDTDVMCRNARDIMGWMVVTAVTEDYCHEAAPGVRAWSRGASFEFPLGNRESVETLLACWRRGKLKCRIRRDSMVRGEDDIAPENMQEQGFDDPWRLETERLVNTVWRVVFQRLNGATAPATLSLAERKVLNSMMEDLEREESRRLHLLVDRRELDHGFAAPAAIEAIHRALPRIRLIFINSDAEPDDKVFVLSEERLTAAIRKFMQTIESCQ